MASIIKFNALSIKLSGHQKEPNIQIYEYEQQTSKLQAWTMGPRRPRRLWWLRRPAKPIYVKKERVKDYTFYVGTSKQASDYEIKMNL
eukprot:3560524-Ditylum_brightwellii.AAC.1